MTVSLSALADDWALAEVVGVSDMLAVVDEMIDDRADGQPLVGPFRSPITRLVMPLRRLCSA